VEKTREMISLTAHTGVPSIRVDQTTNKNLIHAAIRLLIPANRRHEALTILNSVIEPIRLEEGCISCRLYQDLREEGALMLEEIWSSQSDLERHLRTDQVHTVLLVVEMATEYPEIRFDAIAHTMGMEAIQKIRK
jgi:quinol monooxygenase YgiN